jgi:hypothetical protein
MFGLISAAESDNRYIEWAVAGNAHSIVSGVDFYKFWNYRVVEPTIDRAGRRLLLHEVRLGTDRSRSSKSVLLNLHFWLNGRSLPLPLSPPSALDVHDCSAVLENRLLQWAELHLIFYLTPVLKWCVGC